MLKRSLYFAYRLLAALLLVSALVLTALRWWAPSLTDYRSDIEAAASLALGAAVRVGQIEASWRGLEPVIMLRHVTLEPVDPQSERLVIGELRVRPDMLHLLLERELRLSGIDLVGISLTVLRTTEGELQLRDLPFRLDSAGSGLAGLRRLSINRSKITYIDESTPERARLLSAVTVTLLQRTGYLQVHGHAQLPEQYGKRFDIGGRLHGALDDPRSWQGQVYLRGRELLLSELQAELMPAGPVLSGAADIRLWLELEHGVPVSCTGELQVSGLAVGGTDSLFRSELLQALLGWRRIEGGWQFALQDLQLASADDTRLLPGVTLTAHNSAQAQELNGISGRLPLETLSALVRALGDHAGPVAGQLAALDLRGEISGLVFDARRDAGGFSLQQFHAGFSAVGFGPLAALPAFDGLDGVVSGTSTAGSVRLHSALLGVNDTRLFYNPLQFTEFTAALAWTRDGETTALDVAALKLANADLELAGKASIQLPGSGAAPQLDLRLDVVRARVERVAPYLPVGHMSPVTVAWLEQGLAGGRVQGGTVLIQGPLDRLPFDHGEGRLEVRLPVTAATLDYNPGWSPVTGLDAQVDFTGRRMDISSRRGRIRSAELHGVHAQIQDLAHPDLVITGDVHGPLPVMLAELGSSPLGEQYGGFVDRVEASGAATLGLNIDIPLAHDHRPISVRGEIGLQGNSLQTRDGEIELHDIRGQLVFNEHGIQGRELSARLLDRPVTAQVWTDDERPVTYLTLDGRLPMLARMLADRQPWSEHVKEDSDWQLELVMRGQPRRNRPADVDLNLRSSLAGTVIDLPAPLGKSAQDERTLSVTVTGLEGARQNVALNYGADLRARFRVEQKDGKRQLLRGVIALGGVDPLLPDIRQLLVMGKLQELRFSEWQPLFAEGGEESGLPVRLSVKLADLELFGHRLRDFAIEMNRAGSVYHVKAIGTGVEGELDLARYSGRVENVMVNMDHLVLDPVATGADRKLVAWVPDDFPGLQVSIKRLVYDGADFGALELQTTRPAPGQVRINRLVIASKLLDLRLTGDWRLTNGEQLSSIDAEINGGQMGDLLGVFGYQQVIKGGNLTGSAQLGWPGAPWEPERRLLQGNLKLVVKDGQLLDVDPGAGRVLGLTSIAALPRRLRLDFTDLFGKGFAFGRIGGDFVLDNGNAWTSNLEIDGPAANITITGRVGLALRDYDQQVTVTPYLDSSLPLAGALAGGPAVGAAVLVADRLLEGSLGLNEMARRKYTVTGSWDDPQVIPLAPSPADKQAQDEKEEPFE